MSYPVNENRNSISYWKKYEQFKIKIKREKAAFYILLLTIKETKYKRSR